MIGMNFISFLSLLVISAISASIVHSMLKPRVLHKGEAYLCEWIMGWIGAWLGSPVVGHWGWLIPGTTVYLVPAALGALAVIYVVTESVRIIEFLTADISLRETPAFPNEKNKVA